MRLALVGEAPRSQKIVIDVSGRLPGRGAYLCALTSQTPSPDCLERALRRGGIARTLRCDAKIGSSDLLESVGR